MIKVPSTLVAVIVLPPFTEIETPVMIFPDLLSVIFPSIFPFWAKEFIVNEMNNSSIDRILMLIFICAKRIFLC